MDVDEALRIFRKLAEHYHHTYGGSTLQFMEWVGTTDELTAEEVDAVITIEAALRRRSFRVVDDGEGEG